MVDIVDNMAMVAMVGCKDKVYMREKMDQVGTKWSQLHLICPVGRIGANWPQLDLIGLIGKDWP